VGATLLEFAVAVSVFCILALILLDRMAYYQEWAEKANMEYTAASLKSALLMEFSTLMVEGRMRESSTLLQQNPMDWLAPKPANYIGEFDGAAPDTQSRGIWYYDRGARELVYRVNLGRYFRPDSRGRQEVRFHVTRVYYPMPVENGVGASPMPPSGVKLMLVEKYMWF
jgi:general secretion pathway protein G